MYVLDNLSFDSFYWEKTSLSDCWFMSHVRFSVSTFQSTKWDRSPPPFFECCLFEQVKTCRYCFALLYRMLICCSILPPFKSDWDRETSICWGSSAGGSVFWYPCEIHSGTLVRPYWLFFIFLDWTAEWVCDQNQWKTSFEKKMNCKFWKAY